MRSMFNAYLIGVGIFAGGALAAALDPYNVSIIGAALGGGSAMVDWYVESHRTADDE